MRASVPASNPPTSSSVSQKDPTMADDHDDPNPPNPTAARIAEARSRHLCGGVDGDVLAHRPDHHRGDFVCRLRVSGNAARLGIARVSPTGKLFELTISIDEIAVLVMAAAEFRLRVSPPPQDEPRGRRRGAR